VPRDLLIKAESGVVRTETFSVWLPAEPLEKSENGEKLRLVQGLTSTGNKDQQDERMLQDGIDFEPLLSKGHINWNHQPGPANLIGQPLEATLKETPKGFGLWMQGLLYKGKRVAEDAWEHLLLMEELARKGLPFRPVGWSVEGGILERDPLDRRIIRKSVVRQMALTHEPVNADTYAEIAKSLGREWMGDALGASFDFETNQHTSFGSFESFAKSFIGDAGVANTFSAAPLALQNLGGGVTSVLPDKILGRRCSGKCNRQVTKRRKSLAHMVECMGFDEDESFAFLKSLIDCLD
jgi:hypothetical protein